MERVLLMGIPQVIEPLSVVRKENGTAHVSCFKNKEVSKILPNGPTNKTNLKLLSNTTKKTEVGQIRPSKSVAIVPQKKIFKNGIQFFRLQFGMFHAFSKRSFRPQFQVEDRAFR